MKPLLQHASRSLVTRSLSVAPLARSFGSLVGGTSLICSGCLHDAARGDFRRADRPQWRSNESKTWSTRTFSSSSSKRNQDDGKPPQPPGMGAIRMPPPASSSKPMQQPETVIAEKKTPENRFSSDRMGSERAFEPMSFSRVQGRPKEEIKPSLDSLKDEMKLPEQTKPAPEPLPSIEIAQKQDEHKPPEQTQPAPEPLPNIEIPKQDERTIPTPKKHEVVDDVSRVPDEQLPSHRERQRWSLSKRFSNFMDDLLPKLAVVTQKVNTYTGTDYSGVEALRIEIQAQEKLVKARRLAIESAKDSLDTALAHQAASQKKVVALLERKHSWSAVDLESYMALIRSEHTNDQGVREAKDAVTKAEDALEESRGQLEKRERAQYHEEQIWSDTIRRNSTWVTFGLMGVNIFLLLLTLLVFEPWRRRRMVREIKTVLEAQRMPLNTTPVSVTDTANVLTKQNIAAIEEAIDKVFDSENKPSSIPAAKDESHVAPRQAVLRVEEQAPYQTAEGWRGIVAAAQDVVSDRVILIRRVEYTTAILQGAATGAILAAAIMALLQQK